MYSSNEEGFADWKPLGTSALSVSSLAEMLAWLGFGKFKVFRKFEKHN